MMELGSNIIHVSFGGKQTAIAKPNGWQYDYGQILKFDDLELPNSYQVHFSNERTLRETKQMVGNADGVLIPDEYFQSGEPIYAFVYLHTGEDDGETEYCVTIYVNKRPEPTDIEPTPQEQSTIDSLIIQMNRSVEQSTESAESASASEQSASESATASAQSASESAESARQAKLSEENASASEDNAENYATRAETASASAETSADDARQSKRDAEDAVDRAEQSAGQSGYMFFEIHDDGHLYLDKTPNVDVDFYLDTTNGHLYVTD